MQLQMSGPLQWQLWKKYPSLWSEPERLKGHMVWAKGMVL